jgi:ABC-type glycerol-3-phosphate transport system permease component
LIEQAGSTIDKKEEQLAPTMAIIASVPSILAYIVLQRFIRQGLVLGAVK